MPAYITHSIMGSNVYNKLNEEKMLLIPVEEKDIKTFSLGIDLGSTNNKLAYDLNNKNTGIFFMAMINYIKENKLLDNSTIIALLYGHIAHYFLDINCHPLIYYNELGLKNVTIISNHYLIEGYINYYISKNVLKKDLDEIKANYFNQGSVNNIECVNLLNYLYKRIYNKSKIINSYNLIIKLFTSIEKTVKSGLFDNNSLSKISGFDKFLRENDVNVSELININNSMWQNPVTGDKHHESILDLYNKSIIETLEAINDVNKFLYGNNKNLDKIFTNLSYETGVNCNLGHQMIYVKK